MRRFLIILLLLLGLYGCSSTTKCDETVTSDACLRVLFIGNSYTYVNDLPNVFARLAKSGGHRVEAAMAAEGGWTLANHADSARTNDTITSAIGISSFCRNKA